MCTDVDPTRLTTDAVIEAAGVSGWCGLVGLVHPDSAFPFTAERVIRQCLALRGIHNYAPQDLVDTLSFLQRRHGAYPFERLMSGPFRRMVVSPRPSRSRIAAGRWPVGRTTP